MWSKRPGATVQNRITKGKFQGVSLTQYNNRWVFLNLNEHHFQNTDRMPRTRPSPRPRHRSMNLSINPSISTSIYHPLHSFLDKESYLLDYFIRGIGPSCSLSEMHNPYISLVVPLCFISVTLRHTLLAVAANQLCLVGKDQFTEQACDYKHIALQGLRKEISAGVHDDGTVASILMLCFHEVFMRYVSHVLLQSIPC